MSSTLGLSLNMEPKLPFFEPVLSSIMEVIEAMGESLARASLGRPMAADKLGSGSASMARTFLPRCAKILAMTPARVVFPTPPFPEIAIFIFSSGTYHNQKIIKCLLGRISYPILYLDFYLKGFLEKSKNP